MSELMKHAVEAVQVGIKVFPIAGVDKEGNCKCGRGKKCQQTGKHPILPGNWKTYASDSEEQIKKWFSDGEYNIAYVLPPELIVIDVDPKNGGDETLRNFEIEYGELNSTLEVQTGSGGEHKYYNIPESLIGVKIKNKELLKGVDNKAFGGYLVGPGSRHKSGKIYKTKNEKKFSLDEIRRLQHSKLEELFLNENKKSQKASSVIVEVGLEDGKIPEGGRNSFLFSLGCSMRSKGFLEDQIFECLKVVNSKFCNPPLQAYEVQSCSKSISKYAIGNPRKDPPQISLNDSCFNGPLGEAVAFLSEETEGSAIGILVTLLAMVGNYLGRSVYLDLGNISVRPNLFVVVVGNSSTGRKGTTYKMAYKMAKEFLDDKWFNRIHSGVQSGEAIVHKVRDRVSKLNRDGISEIIDEGVNDKRLFLIEDEMARIFRAAKRESSIVSQMLRQAWDGGRLQTMSKISPAVSKVNHISMVGHITSFELQQEIQTNDIFNGFANRCLWVHVERARLLPFGGLPINAFYPFDDVKKYLSKFSLRYAFEFNKGAKELWAEMYFKLNSIPETRDEKINALEARSSDQILKLSLIYAACSGQTEITTSHLESAQSIWNYCKRSISYIFSMNTEGYSPLEEKLIKLMGNNSEVTRTQVRDALNRNSSAKDIDQARDNLMAMGKILVKNQGKTEVWLKGELGEVGNEI